MAGLVKEIDKLVAKNEEKKLAAVVNFTGDPTDDYADKIKAYGKKHDIKNVALTMTADGDRFQVNEDAEVTVMHYVKKTVEFNCAVAKKEELTKDAVKKIVQGAEKILE